MQPGRGASCQELLFLWCNLITRAPRHLPWPQLGLVPLAGGEAS